MNSNSILWTVGIIAVIAFIVTLLIQNFKKKLVPTVSKLQEDVSLFSDSEIGRNLHSLLEALSVGSKDTSVILEKLKTNPQECAKELSHALIVIPENAYNTKWLIVYCISQFELPDFVELLKEIAQSEIPSEKSKSIHHFSTVAEETAIRLRAIEGIKSLAKMGNREAEAVLFELLKSNYLTLSIATCQSLLEINEGYKSRILEMLPKQKQFIIDITRRNASEIPFIKNTERNLLFGKTLVPKPRREENKIQEHSRVINRSKPPKTNK